MFQLSVSGGFRLRYGVGIHRQLDDIAFDGTDIFRIDIVMMVLVTFRAVLARQLDAIALDAIDGADMCAVLAMIFMCSLMSGMLSSLCGFNCEDGCSLQRARWTHGVFRTLMPHWNRQEAHGDHSSLSGAKARGTQAVE